MTKKERKLNEVRAYVKDKLRLFKLGENGENERSKAIVEVLRELERILNQ